MLAAASSLSHDKDSTTSLYSVTSVCSTGYIGRNATSVGEQQSVPNSR